MKNLTNIGKYRITEDLPTDLRFRAEDDKRIIYDSENDEDLCMYFDDTKRDFILAKLNNINICTV